ncbi:MAG: cytochrome C oxidase subunit IV family protein [Myxococcota bacterium]
MASKTQTYIQGKPVEQELEVGPHHGHVTPMSTYWKVFGALLVLTALTVGVSFANLGAASIYVAMVVAIVKASLVVAYFMHLKGDDKFLSFAFFSTLLFVGIFFALTFADIATRGAVNPDWGVKGWMKDHGVVIERTQPEHADTESPGASPQPSEPATE